MADIQFDYFTAAETEQYTFYRIPKALFTESHFQALSREQGWSISYSAASEEWGRLYSGYSGVESALDGIIRAETVENLLSVLTERQRRAAVLFYLEQKTEWQIAEELGITASAVSRILAKSLARMRAGIRRDTTPAGNGTA